MKHLKKFKQLNNYKEEVINKTLSLPNVSVVDEVKRVTPAFYNPKESYSIVEMEYPNEIEYTATDVEITIHGEKGTRITNGELLNSHPVDDDVVEIHIPENKTEHDVERNISFTWKNIQTGVTITQKAMEHAPRAFKYVAQDGGVISLGQIIINQGYMNADGINWDGDFLPYVGTREYEGETYYCYDGPETWGYLPGEYIVSFSQKLENGVTYDFIKKIDFLNDEVDHEDDIENWTPSDWDIVILHYDPDYDGPIEQVFPIKPGNNVQEYEGDCVTIQCRENGYLLSIEIPDSVTNIDDYAFSGCTSLISVTIGNSVTSISYEAFYTCLSLTSVTIPDSVTSISYWAFCDCQALTNITYNGTIEQWYAIDKDYDWNYNVPATTVHCTDGDIPVEDME